MLLRGSEAEISENGLNELCDFVSEFDDLSRLTLVPGPKGKVEPMKIELTKNSMPVRAKRRRYPPAKLDFMNCVVNNLQECGFIEVTTAAEWISVPFIVSNPPPADFRMTIDLLEINTSTKLMTRPIPNLEIETGDMRESRCSASIDFPSGFWQLPPEIISLV